MIKKNNEMKPMMDKLTNKEVETNEDVITNDEKNSQVNEPIIELSPASQKTRFRQNFENGMTVEEARKNTLEHIKQLYAKDQQMEVQSVTQKTKFRQDFEKAVPIAESKRKMIEHINNLYSSNR